MRHMPSVPAVPLPFKIEAFSRNMREGGLVGHNLFKTDMVFVFFFFAGLIVGNDIDKRLAFLSVITSYFITVNSNYVYLLVSKI